MHTVKMIISALLVAVFFTTPALACTGKTVTIVRSADLQQQVLAQMLSILIDARTGTTVEEKIYPTLEAAHVAVVEDDADISIEYTGIIRLKTLNKERIEDPAELYEAVKW